MFLWCWCQSLPLKPLLTCHERKVKSSQESTSWSTERTNKHQGWEEAVKKERDGILENSTWNYDEILSREDLLKGKEKIYVGRVMIILSVKYWELPSLWKPKARIVFRGNRIEDNKGNLAVLMEAKVNPTSMSGINAYLAFGVLASNKPKQSDVVRTYLQLWLATKVITWVELSPELVPDEFKHIKCPCVRLWRSLYGHPESGFHWDKRFWEVMASMGAMYIELV